MTQTTPAKAKVMIGTVAVASIGAVVLGVMQQASESWPRFLLLAAAAIVASRFRVKLPGISSYMSGNLPVVLLAVTQLSLLSSMLIAAMSGIAQSLSSNGRRFRPAQFLFNACILLNAAGLAHWAFHYSMAETGTAARMLLLALAAAAYFVANTTPVAGIIALTEGGNAFHLWHKVFLWTFPNYVLGAGLAAIASAFSKAAGAATLATLMVVLFGVYQSYKLFVGRNEQSLSRAAAVGAGN